METLIETHDAGPVPVPEDAPVPPAAIDPATEAALAEPTAVPVEAEADVASAGPLLFTLHPRVPVLWRVQAIVFVSLVLLPGVLITIGMGKWLGLLAVLLIGVLVVRLVGHYGRRYLATFRCELLDDGLRVARGVWWRNETFVPRARIQHTDVNEGPVARHFGIATLKVFTAGTHVGEIGVEGLARDDAFALRDRLLGRTGHDAL